MATIDRQALRRALGTFVTGVTIITTRDAEGRPVGLTANSFNSVSLDPPLVLWSLALDSHNLPAFRQASGWAVHVLAAGQEALSARFASRGADKFAGLDIVDGSEGAPLLPGCAARFGCAAAFEYDGGDHAIFVGRVVDLATSDEPPLAFHGGRYSRVRQPAAPAVPETGGEGADFGRYFIGHMLNAAHASVLTELRHEYRARGLRGAEYTVLVALGLGEGCTRAELSARAARGGASLPDAAIDALIGRDIVAQDSDRLRLTDAGQELLLGLMAVAQASQSDLERRLSAEDLNLLHDLLARVIA